MQVESFFWMKVIFNELYQHKISVYSKLSTVASLSMFKSADGIALSNPTKPSSTESTSMFLEMPSVLVLLKDN